jgi:histidinol-phosphate aminotransferase
MKPVTTSRRGFLRLIGANVAASATLHCPMMGASRSAIVKPSRLNLDDGLIRLNRNENAYGPSTKVADAVKSSSGSANRYPRDEYDSLIERIASTHNVKAERILLGCGSTEILRVAAFAFLGTGKQLVQASPTFEAMERYARAAGSGVTSVPLTRAFSHDLGGMLAHAAPSATLVYVCNPNNPTASLTPRKDLETFIGKLPESTLVIIDEAYHHYAGESGAYASFIDHPIHDERVIVVRTFSKVYGLAGLRLGYAVAAPKVVQQMRKFATEDSINAVVAQSAMAALNDLEGLNEAIERNTDDRQEFFNAALARMLKPIDSHTNFVMMNAFHPASEVIQHFRTSNILIGRPFPPLDTYIRVSLGLPDEMHAFWRAWDRLPYSKDLMSH